MIHVSLNEEVLLIQMNEDIFNFLSPQSRKLKAMTCCHS